MSVSTVYKTNYILSVDDAPDNLLLVQLALEQEGHDVLSVTDGYTALAQIEKFPPNLVVLDVMMPGIDGYEVTRRMRQNPNLPFIPILLITAHEESDVVKGLDVGADEFIRKPVKVDELQARVRSLLRLKQSIDQRENFVSCLTHDLRTPLVAADRMLTLLKQGIFGAISPQMEEALVTMISSNQNLLQMLNTLLDVYCYDVKQKILSFIPFNLKELAEEVLHELAPLAEEKAVELRLKAEAEVGQVVGDRLELRRVLTNIVGNAIKFTDAGLVEVRLSLNTKPDSNKEVKSPGVSGTPPHNGGSSAALRSEETSELCTGWAVKIEVEDTGVGISLEEQSMIFEQFRQGNHKRSGSGLGLYLCRQIVRSHRGTIEVQSELGKGTLFTIHLPSKQ